MKISKPHHSEARTIWHVTNEHDEVVATLELGQVYDSCANNQFELVEVNPNTNFVRVKQLGGRLFFGHEFTWHISSLLCYRLHDEKLHIPLD